MFELNFLSRNANSRPEDSRHDIYPAKLLIQNLEGGANLIDIRDIALYYDRAPAQPADILSECLSPFGVNVRQEKVGASLGEGHRHRAPHTLRTAQNQRHAPVQIE